MDFLKVPVSHPYFLNLLCKRPQYYQCVIKPLIEFIAKKDLETCNVLRFEKYKFDIYAEDYGELKRYLSKSGFSVHNMGVTETFEVLLDELFHMNHVKETNSSAEYCFFDISLKGICILNAHISQIIDASPIFILLDKKDMQNVKEFMERKGFTSIEVIKKCYWSSQDVLLLAFEKEN